MKSSVINYVPETAQSHLLRLLDSFTGTIKITRPRKTKLGDFRVNRKVGAISITINNDLNQYSFLITLLHELAHFHTWAKHKNSVKPHGIEWKREFITLLHPFLTANVFPPQVSSALQKYMTNPKASSCTDANLYKSLEAFNISNDTGVYISELEVGDNFEYEARGVFKLTKKLRKRLLCTHIKTSKKYIFQPISKVKKITLK